ncbi:MAG TPA: tRNA dihydrouridine synthase DusB [Acholeplasmataceae bacterium]|nr:tRNA dihydrouridine synthase DusB [Acholeplasmataceae bacterium]
MKIGNIKLKNKVIIAPLAGYTNQAYRMIMKEAGAALTYTEMISCKGLIYSSENTWDLTEIVDSEHPVSLQLFGGEVADLVKAAILIDEKTNCDIIDINMGCPVKKVLKAHSGSYLLQYVDLIEEMVSSVVKAVKKPVTVKIRAGINHQKINAIEVAKAIERAGASAIAIHGRTQSDLYRGNVNLDFIKMVKENVNIPVIGNGDIKTIKEALYMLEYTKCDAIMIGRGSLGNPWFIKNLVSCLEGSNEFFEPTKDDRINMIIKHYQLLKDLKGDYIALLEMRSISGFYLKGIPGAKEYRQLLVNAKTEDEFFKILERLRKN